MDAVLTLNSQQLDDVDLHALTFDLCQAINDAGADADAGSINASPQTEGASAGSRGDLVTAGSILLTLIGSGGVVVALVDVLKAYVARDKHLKINLKAKDGTSIEIDGSNLNGQQLQETTELLKQMLEKTA